MIFTYVIEETNRALVSVDAETEEDARIALDMWREETYNQRLLDHWLDRGYQGTTVTLESTEESGPADIMASAYTTHISDHPRWMSVADVAKYCHVHEETVRRWVRSGKLKATKFSRKSGFVVHDEDFIRFIQLHPRYGRKCPYDS